MESLEISAKSVEEATKKALIHLNAGLDEVEITVLNEGNTYDKAGDEEVRIRAVLKKQGISQDSVAVNKAREILQELLEKMGIQAKVDIQTPIAALGEDGEVNPVVLNITGAEPGELIGRRGQTIDALQYLLRLILSRKIQSKVSIMVDADNYRKRRYEDLKILALNVASQVKAMKTSIKLEPMSAFERRIIHLALANDPEVVTESMGEGESRKVVVMPKNKR